MKKRIDFIQLCILIKKEKQPKEITARLNEEQEPIKFHWFNGHYYDSDNDPITKCWKLYGLCIGIYEYEEPILTDSEREYLSSVIKPFRKYVTGISKWSNGTTQHIAIPYFDKGYDGILSFPDFLYGEHYAGMEEGKKYTLEELGL